MWLAESRLVPIQSDHYRSLKGTVRESAFTVRHQSVVERLVEDGVENRLSRAHVRQQVLLDLPLGLRLQFKSDYDLYNKRLPAANLSRR